MPACHRDPLWRLRGYWPSASHLSILVQNLATMLGLGLGIDYALLMVSRFREAICAGNDGSAAAVMAARQAGRTLLISASTVAIGFLALLAVPISEIRSIGIAGFLVAAISVLLTNTVTAVPAVLALLGSRIDAGRMPFTPKLDAQRMARTGIRWRKWGTVIVAHPWLALTLAGAPLLLLAWQATRLDTSVPQGDWLPESAESVQALHALEQMDRVMMRHVYSMRIIVELPADSIAQTDAGWNALDRLSKRLASDPRCARVISISTIAEGNRASLTDLSRETRRTFLSSDGGRARPCSRCCLRPSSFFAASRSTGCGSLRKTGAADLTGVPGATLEIGGIPALNADYQTIVVKHFVPVMTMVVVATLLALLVGFRSLFAAAQRRRIEPCSRLRGVLQGPGSWCSRMDMEAASLEFPVEPVAFFPLFLSSPFAIVFGLSVMDYEVFLVARVLEARRSGLE